MTTPQRDSLALGLLLILCCLLALLGGCATCTQPAASRCGGWGVEVCMGGRWRTVTDCRDVSSADGVRWACEQPEGQVAACVPVEGSP